MTEGVEPIGFRKYRETEIETVWACDTYGKRNDKGNMVDKIKVQTKAG